MPVTFLSILAFDELSSLRALSKKDVMSPSDLRINVLLIRISSRATPSAKKLIYISIKLKTPSK